MKPYDGLLSSEQLQRLSAGQGLRGFEGEKAGTEAKKPASIWFFLPQRQQLSAREEEESK